MSLERFIDLVLYATTTACVTYILTYFFFFIKDKLKNNNCRYFYRLKNKKFNKINWTKEGF